MASDHVEVPGPDFERRLCEILAAYYDAVEAGQVSDRAEWLARYPDLSDAASRFLDDQDRLLELTEAIRPTVEEAASEGQGDDPAGKVIRTLGDYELIKEISRGGMGVVFLARQRSLNRLVALKMLRADALPNKADQERLLREAKAAAYLDHPNIVPIFEVGLHDGHNYFSMKLVDGSSLARRLPDFASDQKAAALLVATVARAVGHAHQRGILHRDLKPSNVLVDVQGQPHVSDFGLAKWVGEDAGLTLSAPILGTPGYMAPEQAEGKKGVVTTATDVYGLGTILYTLLTGRPPFQGESVLETIEDVKARDPEPPSTVNLQVDRDLETICLKCLEKEPHGRYASALALAEDLEALAARRADVGPSAFAAGSPAALVVASSLARGKDGGGRGDARADRPGPGQAIRLRQAGRLVQEQQSVIRGRDQEARKAKYVSDIPRASLLIAQSSSNEARDILDRHRTAAGAEDLRRVRMVLPTRPHRHGRKAGPGTKENRFTTSSTLRTAVPLSLPAKMELSGSGTPRRGRSGSSSGDTKQGSTVPASIRAARGWSRWATTPRSGFGRHRTAVSRESLIA